LAFRRPVGVRIDEPARHRQVGIHGVTIDQQVHDLRRTLEDPADPQVAQELLGGYATFASRRQRRRGLVPAPHPGSTPIGRRVAHLYDELDAATGAPYRTHPPTHEEAAMAAKDRLSSVNERTLELVTSVQERILEATTSYVSAVSGVVPETPSWLPSPPGDLPSAKDLLDETFKFQAQLLEANRNFSLALVEAWQEGGNPAQKATKANKASTASTASTASKSTKASKASKATKATKATKARASTR
jgi:hypothetical protein